MHAIGVHCRLLQTNNDLTYVQAASPLTQQRNGRQRAAPLVSDVERPLLRMHRRLVWVGSRNIPRLLAAVRGPDPQRRLQPIMWITDAQSSAQVTVAAVA